MGKWIFKGDNKWGIWVKKWIPAVVAPTVATGIVYTANYLQVNPLPLDPEYTFISGFLVTILLTLGNLIKHV